MVRLPFGRRVTSIAPGPMGYVPVSWKPVIVLTVDNPWNALWLISFVRWIKLYLVSLGRVGSIDTVTVTLLAWVLREGRPSSACRMCDRWKGKISTIS